MPPIDKKIINFISTNHVATICFIDNNQKPYCINCFYCFIEDKASLIFKSSYGTVHDDFVQQNKPTSGTIIQDQNNIAKLKGVQFLGTIIQQDKIIQNNLNAPYVKKFPLSLAMPGYLWGVQLNFIKFTDNTLGIGTKITWENK